MKKVLLFVLSFVVLDISNALALPRFALKKGDITCGGCHANPTGGGLRSEGGESFSVNQLPMWKRGETFTGHIASGITLGADWRSQFLYFTQKQPASSGIGDTTLTTNTFHAMSYAIELGVQATKTLYGYLRYDPITPNPEAYAMLHIVHPSGELIEATDAVNDVYVKFGAFLPAFGIRFDDHTIYSKGGNASISGFGSAGLFWGYGYRDVGAEAGIYLFDHLSVNVGLYNGNEGGSFQNFATANTNKALCARANLAGELIEDVLSGEIGGSFYSHQLTDGTGANAPSLSLFAIHGGLRAGPISVLAEFDNGKNVNTNNGLTYFPKATAMVFEGTVSITKGLDGLLRFETYENKDISDNVQTQVKSRITVGAQWFPLRFLEVRPEFRTATVEIPNSSNATLRDQLTQTTFLTQIHLFF
ncbi:MAG TPA: hypothetical protein VEW28_06330 [Candidatus Kapabacteria bacterium]|nr:hypothetical protein [Candidatus Kapabacteria bacterium]